MNPNSKAIAFALTYFACTCIHSLRTTWSYSKMQLQLKSSPVSLNKQTEGFIDFTFMLCFGLGLMIIGPLGDRLNKRVFLAAGYTLASVSFMLIPVLYYFSQAHSIFIYLFFMGINALGQSVAGPGSMGILSGYFDKRQSGLVLGLWSSCFNVGNIWGLVSSAIIIRLFPNSWQYPYFFNGILTIVFSVILLNFLQENIDKSKCDPIQDQIEDQNEQNQQFAQVTIYNALFLPRVLEYTIAASCVKASIYGLLFWLPRYVSWKGMPQSAAYIPTMTEFGTICGAAAIGYLGNKYVPSLLITPCLFLSSAIMLVPRYVLNTNPLPYYLTMFLLGCTLGGSFNILSTYICMNLGSQKCIKGNKKAISTVTSVITGIASLFAAATQLILASSSTNGIFVLLSVYCAIAGFALTPTMLQDWKSTVVKN